MSWKKDYESVRRTAKYTFKRLDVQLKKSGKTNRNNLGSDYAICTRGRKTRMRAKKRRIKI